MVFYEFLLHWTRRTLEPETVSVISSTLGPLAGRAILAKLSKLSIVVLAVAAYTCVNNDGLFHTDL